MTSYDENLYENPFFKRVLKHDDFLNEVILNKWTLCVPCIGSYTTKYKITQDDIETHTIKHDEDSSKIFQTYNDKVLNAVPKGFKTGGTFQTERTIKILFEETFFLDENRHIQVVCVDSAFDSTTAPSPDTDLKYDTLQHCNSFLFDENTAWARAQLDDALQKCVVSHKSAGMCLKQLIANAKSTFNKCLAIVNKDFHFSRKVLNNPNFGMALELSVECYVMSYLHQTIFSELCYIFGAKDSALNKILRNLSQVKPSEVEDINPVYFASLPTAREKMSFLNSEQTPREKMQLLCDSLACLPTALETGVAMSMDDLLPLLNYLIIKSEVPNWLANICYMQHFTFAQYTTDDRHEFCLVCFEASLEHIRNGSLNYLVAPVNQSNLEVISLYDTTHNPTHIFRNCVLLNRCDDLAWILGSQSSPVKCRVDTHTLLQAAMSDTDDTMSSDPLSSDPLSSDPLSCDPLSGDVTLSEQFSGSEKSEVAAVEVVPARKVEVAPAPKKCHPLCSCDICEHTTQNVRWRDINVDTAFDGSGVRILHIAAQNNYNTMIDLLVELGADVSVVDSAGRTALHLACQRGALSAVLLLIHHHSSANAVDNLGRTPLHELCERGHTDTLQALVYQKINLRVNAEANNGDTPLHLAARYGYGDIVSILLDVGASMSIRNNKGETPLSAAQNKYIWHILQLFSSELELEEIKKSSVSKNLNEEQEKLFRLCAEGDIQMIKHKLKIKDFKTTVYNRPRLRSIKKKCHPLCQCEECYEIVAQSQIAKTLLCNSDQYTLLHIAALYGHADLALLFSARFNWMLDAVTSRHRLSPLHLACQYNNESIVDILITAGCDMNCRDGQGNTPLHFTCTNGHSGCAFLLLEGGCDIKVVNERGDTALHHAARWGHIPLVNLLIRYKSPTGTTNKDGLLPLHLSQFGEVNEALRRAMGLRSTEQSEDETVYTDCQSDISTPSPSSRRKSPEGFPGSPGYLGNGSPGCLGKGSPKSAELATVSHKLLDLRLDNVTDLPGAVDTTPTRAGSNTDQSQHSILQHVPNTEERTPTDTYTCVTMTPTEELGQLPEMSSPGNKPITAQELGHVSGNQPITSQGTCHVTSAIQSEHSVPQVSENTVLPANHSTVYRSRDTNTILPDNQNPPQQPQIQSDNNERIDTVAGNTLGNTLDNTLDNTADNTLDNTLDNDAANHRLVSRSRDLFPANHSTVSRSRDTPARNENDGCATEAAADVLASDDVTAARPITAQQLGHVSGKEPMRSQEGSHVTSTSQSGDEEWVLENRPLSFCED